LNPGTNAQGVAKRARIDRFLLNGAVLQTESTQVYSAGTWAASGGCRPGFRRSEYLQCSGYFQFGMSGSRPSDEQSGFDALAIEATNLAGDGAPCAKSLAELVNFGTPREKTVAHPDREWAPREGSAAIPAGGWAPSGTRAFSTGRNRPAHFRAGRFDPYLVDQAIAVWIEDAWDKDFGK
jgi:hypothetical protein